MKTLILISMFFCFFPVVVGLTIPTAHLLGIMEVVEVTDVKALTVVISHTIVRRIIISARTTMIVKNYLLIQVE